eukprot:1150734-Pelagomonas_calceolata.AAC.2
MAFTRGDLEVQGPWCLLVFRYTDRRSKAGRSGLAPTGHLRGCCSSRLTLGIVSINFDAADYHAGHQGGAAGLHKIYGANFSKV